MSYIGNKPNSGTFAIDTFSGDNATDTFTLRYPPASKSSILVFVNNVRQNTSSFSITGSNITLSPAPASGTNNIEVVFLGIGLTPYTVARNSIGAAELQDNGITNAKIADNVITGSKLVANTITSREIADSAVLANNIASGAITSSKLDSNLTITSNLTVGNVSVSGTVTATDFNSTSDIALKDNLLVIKDPMEVINQLNGFSFNWKKDGKKSYGLSAQEVEKVLPDIVVTHSNGYKGVNYLNIIAFLLEAIKGLQKQIDELKK